MAESSAPADVVISDVSIVGSRHVFATDKSGQLQARSRRSFSGETPTCLPSLADGAGTMRPEVASALHSV